MLKATEHFTNARLHLEIGIKDNQISLRVTQSNGQGEFERTTPRFTQNPSLETRSHHKKLSFTHCSFQAEQKPVVHGARIIESLFIQDQGTGERTDFQEVVPIAGVTGEPGDF